MWIYWLKCKVKTSALEMIFCNYRHIFASLIALSMPWAYLAFMYNSLEIQSYSYFDRNVKKASFVSRKTIIRDDNMFESPLSPQIYGSEKLITRLNSHEWVWDYSFSKQNKNNKERFLVYFSIFSVNHGDLAPLTHWAGDAYTCVSEVPHRWFR